MVDDLSAEDQIERLQEESRVCIYPTDALGVKKRYKDTALILFKEDLDDGTLRNYLTFGTRRSSAVSQFGNTPLVIRRSRSSNGELTTVAEQVATLQGRSTRSNYTLLEAGEKETDSDDENVFHESRFNSDDSFAVRENNGKDSKVTTDSNDSVARDQAAPASSDVVPQSAASPQENTTTISEKQEQTHDNKKSFSHYDAPVQPCRESAERDAAQPLEEDKRHDSNGIAKDSEVPNEVLEASTLDGSLQVNTEAHNDTISISSNHTLSPQAPDDGCSQVVSEHKDTSQTLPQDACEPTPVTGGETRVQDTRSSPEVDQVDHEAILRDYVRQPSRQSKSPPQANGEPNTNTPHTHKTEPITGALHTPKTEPNTGALHTPKTEPNTGSPYTPKTEPNTEPKDNFKPVELNIFEPTDSLIDEVDRVTGGSDTQKALTTSDILSDDSDVVFIDDGSPALSRIKSSCGSCSGSTEEVLQDYGEGPSSLHEITDPGNPTTPNPPSVSSLPHGNPTTPNPPSVSNLPHGNPTTPNPPSTSSLPLGNPTTLNAPSTSSLPLGNPTTLNPPSTSSLPLGNPTTLNAPSTSSLPLGNPQAAPQPSEPDAASDNSPTKTEEVALRRRQEGRNSFRDLPIRSPTPPRRRPQRSDRTPKLREKNRQRNSSLALTSDEEAQELLANGTRSASPTSRAGDFRFFSFSLKKEKSKSATSLGSKRNRERVRLTSVKLSLEDPGTVNPKLVPGKATESHLDSSGKRVGVRSMIIDGTIKRNFIVIHPSDDSDTLGLAPMAPRGSQKEATPAGTPEALSTVKTRIAAPNTEKLEAVKRISSQGGLKEELSNIPENLKGESKGNIRSFSISQISKSLRSKQNKKNWEHLPLRPSHSVSSEPLYPSPSSSQILYKSPPSLSRVDCDSPTASAQNVSHTADANPVSKLCVVM